MTDIEVPKSPHRKPTKAEATAALREKCIAQGSGPIQMRADQLVDFLDEITGLETEVATREAALRRADAVLAAYNQWEADLILENGSWTRADGLPSFTDELWDRFMEIQGDRNEARALAKQTTRAAPAEGGE